MLMLFADESSTRVEQRWIAEGLLHHALAVVERAAHGEGPHVVAPAGELLRLPRRNQPLRIEQDDVDPGRR